MNNVKVYGYTDWYFVKPKVKIYKGEVFIGEVLYRDIFEFEIEEDCIITFKCGIRRTEVKVYNNKDNEIQLEFDRITGQLIASFQSLKPEKDLTENSTNTSYNQSSSLDDISKKNDIGKNKSSIILVKKLIDIILSCPCDGIGRRAGFKIQW